MADRYVGEIRMFGGEYAPKNWVLCDGALFKIMEYGALFSLIANTYGGDGKTTFGVPDMRGRIPIDCGHGPESSYNYDIGTMIGAENITLTIDEIPAHLHPLQASKNDVCDDSPAGRVTGVTDYYFYDDFQDSKGLVPMAKGSILEEGGGEPHTNMMPYLAINFIIATNGTYPERH